MTLPASLSTLRPSLCHGSLHGSLASRGPPALSAAPGQGLLRHVTHRPAADSEGHSQFFCQFCSQLNPSCPETLPGGRKHQEEELGFGICANGRKRRGWIESHHPLRAENFLPLKSDALITLTLTPFHLFIVVTTASPPMSCQFNNNNTKGKKGEPWLLGSFAVWGCGSSLGFPWPSHTTPAFSHPCPPLSETSASR